MEPYERPSIATEEFRDDEGNVIPYGDRWREDGPPGEVYSVLTHPERFRPLHDVARALIAYLERAYDVTVSEDPAHLADLPDGYVKAETAVRLTPAKPHAAPMTIVLTTDLRVVIQAGALVVEPFPVCGCDACDDTWESEADRLEDAVFAVVAGGLSESVGGLRRLKFSYGLVGEHGGSSGVINNRGFSTERLKSARAAIRSVPGAWAPWSPREA